MDIRVPPPFSGGFFAILPNYPKSRQPPIHPIERRVARSRPRTHLDPPGRNLMSSIFKIKHCPEIGIRIWFTDLVQRRIILINDFVDWRDDTGIFNRPS